MPPGDLEKSDGWSVLPAAHCGGESGRHRATLIGGGLLHAWRWRRHGARPTARLPGEERRQPGVVHCAGRLSGAVGAHCVRVCPLLAKEETEEGSGKRPW